MSREPRDEIAGGIYHVTNRGNRKALICEDDRDRRRFIEIMREERETYGAEVYADGLMGNHFHLIVATPHGNLADFVGGLESRFASYSNWRHSNVGHLFGGRYRATTIEDDIHLLIALCYVFLNPVSAGLVERIDAYRWSTYRATIGLDHT